MALYQQITPRRALLSPMLHYDLFKRVDSVMMLRYPDADAVKSLHSLISNITEEQIKQAELEKRTAIGAKAPEIALPSFDGNVITLSSLRGKYVLLNFWASWNNESRILNKSLVGIYWRYKNAGFDIYQVSLDKNRDAWLTAISSDGLAWHNVTDFKMWDSPIVPLYGIKNIPFSVLIDKEGKIIAKGNDIEIIKNKLFEIFKY